MHKNQELLTCSFVLLLSKAFVMLITCLCDLVQICATALQVFPALNFLVPHCIRRRQHFPEQRWVWFFVVFFVLGLGFLEGGVRVGFFGQGWGRVFPQDRLPFMSKQVIFGCNKDFLLSWKTAGTKCMHSMLQFITCCIIKLNSFSLQLVIHLDKDERDLCNQKPDTPY